MNHFNGEHVGGVAHFISALLQTAGLYGQADVLAKLGGIIQTLGSLVFTVVVIGAIISVALFGNYRRGAYLLLGPALFYTMLMVTAETDGTLLRFGTRVIDGSKEDQQKVLELIGSEKVAEGKSAKVSWFFVVYDNVITEVVQNIAGLLIDETNRRDLIAAARERMYSRMLTAKGDSAGFVSLLSLGVIGHCGEATAIGMDIASGKYAGEGNSAVRAALEERRQQYISQPNIKIEDPDLRTYILTAVDGLDETVLSDPLNCEQIWEFSVEAASYEYEIHKAGIVEDSSSGAGGGEGIPWEEAIEELERLIGDGDAEVGKEILAAVIIRNTLRHSQHGAMTKQVFSGKAMNAPRAKTAYGAAADALAQGNLLKIVYFGSVIPYFQGLFLFGLSIAYPFFTIFLLIPGKVQSFFLWMGLWLWVKSWDVGFAFIYFIRDFLFGHIAKSLIHNERMIMDVNQGSATGVPTGGFANSASVDFSSPETVFRLMGEGDLLASTNTYALIISLLQLSVPVITAHLCLGATSLMEILNHNISQGAERFGNWHGDGALRDFATRISKEIHQKEAMAVMSQVEWAKANPGTVRRLMGFDKEGNAQWQEFRRDRTGDGTHANFMLAEANRALYEFHFSQQHSQDRALLAAVTSRRMTFSMGMEGKMLDAFKNDIREQFTGVPMGMGQAVFGWDTKAADYTEGGNLEGGGRSTPDGASGDGGE